MEIDLEEFSRFVREALDDSLVGLDAGPYTIDEWWDAVREELEERVLAAVDQLTAPHTEA